MSGLNLTGRKGLVLGLANERMQAYARPVAGRLDYALALTATSSNPVNWKRSSAQSAIVGAGLALRCSDKTTAISGCHTSLSPTKPLVDRVLLCV